MTQVDKNEQVFDYRAMGFNNPAMPWRELERRLSGNGVGTRAPAGWDEPGGDGGDSPAWSRGRAPLSAPEADPIRTPSGPRYAELHAHSNFSFLDGASSPEDLAVEAARLGLEAMALTDHGGFYGVVRFAEAAREVGLPTVFGVELTLDAWQPTLFGDAQPRSGRRRAKPPPPSRTGTPDPPGRHVVVLARQPAGYAALSTLITRAQMAGEKSAPRLSTEQFLEALTANRDHLAVLTGGRKGSVPAALVDNGPAVAGRELDRLIDAAGADNVFVELWDHADPLDSSRNDAMAQLATNRGTGLLCTNGVHYATPSRRKLATALAAVRARSSLDQLDGWLPAAAMAHIRSGTEQARRFARYPGVVEAAADLGRECAFDLSLVAPQLPPYPCPEGLDEMGYLRRLVEEGASARYGPRHSPRIRGAWEQIDHELELIKLLGFPGYFLVVWDIVSFCRVHDIYCQGRGSAANSAACYALGITNADAVSLGLLFERFLSPERDGPPDIDLDIESDRREEVIQYVFNRYGRDHTAQVANIITYRARSSVRDMAKALGYATGQQDAWTKQLDRYGGLSALAESAARSKEAAQTAKASSPGMLADVVLSPESTERSSLADARELTSSQWRSAGAEPVVEDHDIPLDVIELASQVEHFPRHLGIHSGGMVICDRPVIEVCPVEWARMENRSVLQWDKDDCAATGLVKFDLLGLGMLSAVHYSVDLIREAHGVDVDLAALPQEDAVYEMLCEADSIGVFQVESRAQMATLPRLRPRCFYDLVVEIALIRPGPIQGGSVHPYIRRRNGKDPVTYLHPLLENSLAKTLGIPLFQEQLMQMAIDVAGFSPAESDELRQAMGSKRSRERMERLRRRLYEGMFERGVTPEIADEIWDKMAAFANYGFPESHSVSFAYLVYASSWIKLHYPAAFCAALLNAQPMGFYSPHSLVQDARRHGVEVRTPDLNASADTATLEPCADSHAGAAVRLGLSSVRSIGDDLALEIAELGPYDNMEQLVRRAGVNLQHLEALATAGAFGCFGLDRRQALWAAGAVAQSKSGRLEGIVTGTNAPMLPGMSLREEAVADLWATGVSPDGHPTKFFRDELGIAGVRTADELKTCEIGRVLVAGVVTHRQRPATAQGTMFINLEDETGLINVVVSKGCWIRFRTEARSAPALLVRGRLERHENVVNIIAEKLEPLVVPASVPSRDFR
ncbi:MAG: error-prone DNA polymerase [Candidatus Poriferisodalaceae bacterium]|jgi:error-prone DNA polymerase